MSDELERRIETLEREVRELRARVEAGAPARSFVPSPSNTRPAPRRERAGIDLDLEALITKIGVALVLLGIAFLLKYGYDHGWLTESMRVVMGLTGGTALLGAGFHQREENPNFASALMGGALAAFYGSIFAANSLYGLIPWTVALAGMVGTTMLGFVLAMRQKREVISCIAAIGGFATPFLLDGADGASMLEAYTLILLAGTTAVYLFHGWRSLLLTTAVGSVAVLIPASLNAADGGAVELVTVAFVIGAMVVATSIIPAVQAALDRAGKLGSVERIIAVVTPMAAIGLFQLAADEKTFVVWICAGLLSLVYFGFHSLSQTTSKTYVAIGGALAASAGLIVIGVAPMACALASLGVIAHFLAREEEAPELRLPGYMALAPLGLWTAALLLSGAEGVPFMNSEGLQMVLATSALVAVAATHQPTGARWGHYYVATFAGLATLAHQLSAVSDGMATAAWGLVAVAVLVFGFVEEQTKAQYLGLTVVLLTAGKLLMFDLETVDTLLRVGLFVTFGAALLGISYWRGASPRKAVA